MDKFNSDKEKIQHAIATIKLRFHSGIVTNELKELLAILETPVEPPPPRWTIWDDANLPDAG